MPLAIQTLRRYYDAQETQSAELERLRLEVEALLEALNEYQQKVIGDLILSCIEQNPGMPKAAILTAPPSQPMVIFTPLCPTLPQP